MVGDRSGLYNRYVRIKKINNGATTYVCHGVTGCYYSNKNDNNTLGEVGGTIVLANGGQ